MNTVNTFEVAKAVIQSGNIEGIEKLLLNLMLYGEITPDEYSALNALLLANE